jgi:hypothetical protein
MVVVVGISFNLIIIRVNKGIAVGDTPATNTHTSSTPSIPLHLLRSRRTQRAADVGVEVTVSTVVHQDHDPIDNQKTAANSIVSDGEAPKRDWDAV